QRHRAYGNVSNRLVLTMGPPAAVASLIGAFLSRDASDQVLLWISASSSFFGGVLLVLPVRAQDVAAHEVRVNTPLAVALAIVIGIFGGMVGIGAIAFIVAALIYFLRVPPRIAIGSSLGLGMFGAVAALIGKEATAQVDPKLALIDVASPLLGSPLGAYVSDRTRPDGRPHVRADGDACRAAPGGRHPPRAAPRTAPRRACSSGSRVPPAAQRRLRRRVERRAERGAHIRHGARADAAEPRDGHLLRFA